MSGILNWGIDARLVRNTLRGDKNAFGRLVQRHLPTVEAVAMSYAQGSFDVEDVSQEAFLKAYQSLDTLRERSKFGPWIATITRNVGLRMAQRGSREVQLSDGQLATLSQAPPNHERDELLQLIAAQLPKLPDETREVLLLHYYADQSLRDVAATLGISRDAAAKRLQRGRSVLSVELQRALGVTGQSPDQRRARAKQIASVAVASLAAWEANATAAASLAVLPVSIFAAALKPTVIASIVTAGAFVGFLSYLSYNTRNAEGRSAAAQSVAPSQPATTRVAQRTELGTPSAQAEKPARALTGPGSITVMVTSEKGQPAERANAYVELIDWPEFTQPPAETLRKDAETDASGVARFTHLPLGLYAIAAEQGNMMWGDYTQLGDKSTHSDSALTLRAGKSMDGTVIDSAGNPVTGAVVYPHSSPWILNIPWGIFSTLRMVSDEHGRIHRDLLPQLPLRFCIVADGYARTLTGQFNHGDEPLQLVVLRGGTFSGTVVNEDTGIPIPRIALEVQGDTAVSTTPIESGDNGEFASPNLQAGNYQIVLKEDGYTYAAPVSVDVNEKETTQDVRVALQMGGTISGYVRDAESGEGIAGATVRASAPGQPARNSTPTHASGAYAIFGLGEASYSVGAEAEGYFADIQRDGVAAKPGAEVENIDISMKRGFLVRGRVLEADGRGATTAHIHSVTEDGECIAANIASTDGKSGAFHVLLPRDAGSLWLKAYTMFGSTEIAGPIEVTDENAADVTLRATVSRDCEVDGTVVNASGTPIPFIDVWAFFSGVGVYSEVTCRQAFTDQSGHFTMGKMHPGRYSMIAGYGQGGQVADVSVDIQDGHSEHGVVIVFSRITGSKISGRVTGNNGKPISGAVVAVLGPGYGEYPTGPDGEFSIARTMEGEYRLRVSHAAYTTAYLDPIQKDTSTVSVVMQRRAAIEGRVLDGETRQPVAKFEIVQILGEGQQDRPRQFSNLDGAFQLGQAEAGQTVLQIVAPGYQMERIELDAAPGSKVQDIEILLHPGGNVSGTVISSEGTPIANALVFAGEVPGGIHTVTGPNGDFTFAGLPLEEVTITAIHDEHAKAAVRVLPVAGEETNIQVTLPNAVSLYVTVTINGRPAQGAIVNTELQSGVSPDAPDPTTTDATGRAFLGIVPPGEFEIVVQSRLGESVTWVSAGKKLSCDQIDPDQGIPIDIATGTGVITGTVTINDSPVVGEIVSVACGGGQLFTYSQSDGSFRLDGVLAGNIEVSSGPSQEKRTPRGEVHVDADQITNMHLTL